jgi:hypothetical protein
LEGCGAGPFFTVVDEPRECTASTRAGEEGQLSIADDLEELVANLELTATASVVPTSTESNIYPSSFDELSYPPISIAI